MEILSVKDLHYMEHAFYLLRTLYKYKFNVDRLNLK